MTRIALLGTPQSAVVALRALYAAGHDVALVVTGADRRRGRGGVLTPTPVKQVALELGIEVSSRVADVVDAGVELGVVVAFGQLIGADVLAKVPMVNLHFSLLPRWRGAAPVERAILAGDETTGVCLMALEETLDTGPVFSRVEIPIFAGETASELRERLSEIGAQLLLDGLKGGSATLGTAVPQVGEVLYAKKIQSDDLQLDWQSPALELERVVRVGRAWTTFEGKRIIVERVRLRSGTFGAAQPAGGNSLPGPGPGPGPGPDPEPGTIIGDEVVCGSGSLELVQLRPEGRRPMSFEQWQRGLRAPMGQCLGT
jgi:methionyl-tRNA formyltransferase